MAIQAALGSDIAMAFDHCPPSDAPREAVIEDAMTRTTALGAPLPAGAAAPGQLRFGIVQGGSTSTCAARTSARWPRSPFDGLALGGLGVGEAPPVMYEVIAAVAPRDAARSAALPHGRGHARRSVDGIGAGIDMFDCVMPTRNARNGQLFVKGGKLNIANALHRDADARRRWLPVRVLRRHSRAYLSHLFHAEELLYYRLASVHNLQHYLDLAAPRARDHRRAIRGVSGRASRGKRGRRRAAEI